MRPTTEFSIELTDQELLTPPDFSGLVEVDDICQVELTGTQSVEVNTVPATDYELVEIELTPEEMDELLSDR